LSVGIPCTAIDAETGAAIIGAKAEKNVRNILVGVQWKELERMDQKLRVHKRDLWLSTMEHSGPVVYEPNLEIQQTR
jgi:hypothetical protein